MGIRVKQLKSIADGKINLYGRQLCDQPLFKEGLFHFKKFRHEEHQVFRIVSFVICTSEFLLYCYYNRIINSQVGVWLIKRYLNTIPSEVKEHV